MPPDPLPAVLDQLAAHREDISQLDVREASHFAAVSGQLTQLAGMLTTLSRTLADDTAAIARLDALDRQVNDLAARLPSIRPDGDDGYQPRSAPAWWKLIPAERRAPLAELRAWVEQVYRPGYGHLAVLGSCWEDHDLCLYGLDILSQLWSVLYLQPDRSTSLLSAQAEYQARILPALAAQLAAETSRCGHDPAPGYRRGTP